MYSYIYTTVMPRPNYYASRVVYVHPYRYCISCS